MALSVIKTASIAADAVDNTILDVADNFAFTGTVSFGGTTTGAGKDWIESAAIGTLDSATHTVTGIPAGTREIIMTWNNVGCSASTNTEPRIQLGTSSGVVTSGYVSFYEYVFSTSTHSSATITNSLVSMGNWGSSADFNGYIYCFCSDTTGHMWFSRSAHHITTSYNAIYRGYGSIDLSAQCDRISMSVQNQTYNQGTARVFYR